MIIRITCNDNFNLASFNYLKYFKKILSLNLKTLFFGLHFVVMLTRLKLYKACYALKKYDVGIWIVLSVITFNCENHKSILINAFWDCKIHN